MNNTNLIKPTRDRFFDDLPLNEVMSFKLDLVGCPNTENFNFPSNDDYDKDQNRHPKLGSWVYQNIGKGCIRKVRLVGKSLIEKFVPTYNEPGTSFTSFSFIIKLTHSDVEETVKPSQVYNTMEEAMNELRNSNG